MGGQYEDVVILSVNIKIITEMRMIKMIEVGNIYWYPKSKGWCKHGFIFIVKGIDDELYAIDTYWNSKFKHGEHDYKVSNLNEEDLKFLMKIEDIKEVSKHEFYQYDVNDRFCIPIGGLGELHERYIVNKNASKNIENIKEQLKDEIEKAEYNLTRAKMVIEEKTKQLFELENNKKGEK